MEQGIKPRIRWRYIRVLPQAEGEQGIGVFEFGKDGWREITLFHITDEGVRENGYKNIEEYIEAQRIGVRIYARG